MTAVLNILVGALIRQDFLQYPNSFRARASQQIIMHKPLCQGRSVRLLKWVMARKKSSPYFQGIYRTMSNQLKLGIRRLRCGPVEAHDCSSGGGRARGEGPMGGGGGGGKKDVDALRIQLGKMSEGNGWRWWGWLGGSEENVAGKDRLDLNGSYRP